MRILSRFWVATVLMAATTFAFTSCDSDKKKTEQGSSSVIQENQNEESNGIGESSICCVVNGSSYTNSNGENSDNNDSGYGISGTHDYVDLGLPSGTLWATCNVGATRPEEYGDYFAWGERETKEEYSFYDRKWWNDVEYSDLKEREVIDSNGNLTSVYDAATANWGKDWRMPTEEEIEELTSLEN